MLRRVHRPRRAFAARQCGAPVIVVDLRLVRRVVRCSQSKRTGGLRYAVNAEHAFTLSL
ncbi:hypothetical protein M3J09_012711 [Ascochyta lentis]